MKVRTMIAVVASLATVAAALQLPATTPASASGYGAITADDFLAADGAVLRAGHGQGEVVNLRGTNLGGWLTHENWMSPLGEFALDRSGWTASASSGAAANMLDGSLSSTWTSDAPQNGSEWILVDLGEPTLVNRISLDAGSEATGSPAFYEVVTSSDGASWASVAASAAITGATEVTTTRFAPQVVRYVRVEQKGTAPGAWTIAELNLFSDPVVHNNNFTATASASSSPPADGLDGDVTTAWTTGSKQVPGQTYTIDLHANTEVSRIMFDSGAAHADGFPATYEISASSDGSTWAKIASGFGENRITVADLRTATWMRHVRIMQTGEKASPWSIAEVSVTSTNNFDRFGWTLTSSPDGDTGNLVDGHTSTRWTTNAPQSGGEYVQVDFGARLTFNNVFMDVEKNTEAETDYPRGFTVDVSDDASSWRTVATGSGTFKATNINFPATGARHLRITQTGSSGSWWSIGELNVALNSDDYSLRLALEDRFSQETVQNINNTHRNTWITEADLDNIANIGLNAIRLPIGWNELLHLDGTWKDHPWEKIDWLVKKAGERGIYVILDLHTVPGGGCPWGSCGRVGPNPNGYWGSTTYQDWVVGIWEAMAARYKDNPTIAGFDLTNEPLVDYDEDRDDVTQKSNVYDRLYSAVRAIDPDHTIFLAAFFGWDNIAPPSTYGWTNVVYQVHPYDMPNAHDWNAQDALVNRELADVTDRLVNPGVPVLYGEYSLYYYDDVWAKFMAGLNALDVSWTNWTYKVRGSHEDGGGYWGFYNTNLHQVPIINSDDAATFRARLAKFGTAEFEANERLIATVAHYADGLSTFTQTAVPRSGWTASASVTEPGGSPSGAIDGKDGTLWSTGTSQTSGQWFQVDMGATHSVGSMTIQTRSSDTWDYPRSFEVSVSTDGTSWTTVATGPGFGWKRPISFTATNARYIRVVQTGSAPEWWSIGDLTVYTSAP